MRIPLFVAAIALTAAIAAPAQAVDIVFEKVPEGTAQPVKSIVIKMMDRTKDGEPQYGVEVDLVKPTTTKDAAVTAAKARALVIALVGINEADGDCQLHVWPDGSHATAIVGSTVCVKIVGNKSKLAYAGGTPPNLRAITFAGAVVNLTFDSKPSEGERLKSTEVAEKMSGRKVGNRMLTITYVAD